MVVDEFVAVGIIVALLVGWMIKLAFDLKSFIRAQNKTFNEAFSALEEQEKNIQEKLASINATMYTKTSREYVDQRLDSLMLVLSAVKKK